MTTEKVNKALDKAHGQSKFKAGDRVVWYDVDDEGCEVRDVGTVVSALRYAVYVRDENDVVLPHHAKSLRRLVKRERRRVWIRANYYSAELNTYSFLSTDLNNDRIVNPKNWIEFVEARKRGGK